MFVSLAEHEDRLATVRHSLIDRLGLCGLLWRHEALDSLGEIGKTDHFRYKSRALIYERLAELVDAELDRERVRGHLKSRRQRSPG